MKNKTPPPDLISAYTFAERKGVTHSAVYYRIKIGDIVTTPVGKFNLINWDEYQHINFPFSGKLKEVRAAV